MKHASGWGPDGRKGAISITFDNLGEVAEEALGLPPILGTGGKHLSVEILPQLLEVLHGTRITYFIEAWNCKAYPELIETIRDAGHEVGVHAWRHENWSSLSEVERSAVLERSVNAFREIGIDVIGFRPPGGSSPLTGLRRNCVDHGLKYVSPLGRLGDDTLAEGIVSLPFIWHHVDAYMLHPNLGGLRKSFGDPEQPYSLGEWSDEIKKLTRTVKIQGIHATLIFHPFMLGREARAVEILSSLIAAIRHDDGIWLASCDEIVDWMTTSSGFGRALPTGLGSPGSN